ncbi:MULTISPECIES: LacI family DNA-binding transcriptional regulator [unclassified Plantibacter]|uniref:LacI family DNA-binding transcriptional regulator n=1 Tax=unclassified Plantibacter TaxID=2624265 RepID=UPI003D33CC27
MQERGPAKLIDVARLAGVAKTTASDALSGGGRVSEATRETVLAAARELGYAPNSAAQYLRKGATGTIAVVLPEILSRSPYYMAVVFGIVGEAALHDYDVTIVSPTEHQRRDRAIRADGIIIGDPRRGDPSLPVLLGYPVPVVSLEHVIGVEQGPDGLVWSAHERAMTELLGRVDATGATRPALIVAADDTDWTAQLARSFRAGCESRGVEPIVGTVPFEALNVQVRAAAERLLDEHPDIDAIVCAPDASAVEVTTLLRERGRVPGEDIVVVSCVDSLSLSHVQPTVTAIDLRPRDAGIACASLLFDLIDGRSPTGTEIEYPLTIVDRESTAARIGSGRV